MSPYPAPLACHWPLFQAVAENLMSVVTMVFSKLCDASNGIAGGGPWQGGAIGFELEQSGQLYDIHESEAELLG